MDSVEKSDEDFIAIRPEWTTVDRILSRRKSSTGEREYYVKWKELTYEECTWENESDISAFQPQIERFNEIQSRRKKSGGKPIREPRYFNESPTFLSGGTLHPYQLEGLHFLRYSWYHNRGVILGDEMGLGKTIQSIAFLASLFEDKFGPHLVVAPLSTLRNWEREFATWAPQMNVVMYFGAAASREIIKKYEFYYPKEKPKKLKKKNQFPSNEEKKQSRIKFDVLLTSYEMINMDSAVLKNIEWECLVVDEGHRLKNKDSKLFGQLKEYNTKHRVLLTGTPVQNNLGELFMLMHFLEGESFGSIAELQEEFKDMNQDKKIEKLHGMLKPHLLRRRRQDGTVVADKEWWDTNTEGHSDWKKFKKGMPDYLPEMDKMFDGVLVNGSTSFIAGQPTPIESDSSEEEGADDQEEPHTDDLDEPFTPASVHTKRASSTSMTASRPRKRSKSPAVRAMNNHMRAYITIAERELNLLEKIWKEKKDAMLDQQKARELKVKKVNQLARDCGVTPTANPALFRAILKIIHCENAMDLFIDTDDAGRILILKEFDEDDCQSACQSAAGRTPEETGDDDFEEFMMMMMMMEDDDVGFIFGMYQYAIHLDKHLTKT